MDRFVEVCKARIAIGTFLALTIVTLTGFGLQNKRFELFFIAAFVPFGLLFVIDTLLKSRYGAPFLYIGLVTEYELYGTDSAAMLYLRFTPEQRSEFLEMLKLDARKDRTAGYAAFRRRYAYRGMNIKMTFVVLATMGELALAFAYYPASATTPKPSLERPAIGKALGPPDSEVHHPSSGPSALPASAPQLKR